MKKKLFSILFSALCFAVMCAFCSCDMGEGTPEDSDLALATANPTLSHDDTGNTTNSPAPLETMFENVGDAIENFAEGTVENIEDLPDIVKAITDKFQDATVTGITHAMHLNEQVYEVKFTDDKGVTRTAYVSPDGKTVTEAAEPGGSADPSASPEATD